MALTYEQIEKQSRFINKDEAGRGTGTENNGIPIGSNDLVQIQENARADSVALLEFFREHTKEANGNIGSSVEINGVDYERGLILQGCRYKKADNNGPRDIEPGKMYLHGEVVNFEGSSIDIRFGKVFWVWREEIDYTISSRVFKNGITKNVLKIPTYSTGLSNSPNTPPTGMSATSQHVRYDYANMDTLNGTVCENYTLFKATGLANLKEQNGQGPLISLSALGAFNGSATAQSFHNKRNATFKLNFEGIPTSDWMNIFDLSGLGFMFNQNKRFFLPHIEPSGGGEIGEEPLHGRVTSAGIFQVRFGTNIVSLPDTFNVSIDLTIENDAWSGSETKQTERWMRHPDDNTEPL